MNAAEAGQMLEALQRMHNEMTSIQAWLYDQRLERGVQRLPVQMMRTVHQLDEMMLSLRKYAERNVPVPAASPPAQPWPEPPAPIQEDPPAWAG